MLENDVGDQGASVGGWYGPAASILQRYEVGL